MLHRLAFPLLYFIGPRILPRIIPFLRLVWRLQRDKRVPIVLRALVPLAIVYVLSPLDLIRDRVPVIGRFDDLIVLVLAVLFLVKLSPQHAVDEHLGKPRSPRPEDKDPSKVVDGSSRLVDE
jgi:uncharacterized membrane protein YkvA (DUF1232 family)